MLETRLDKLARPQVRILNRSFSSFQACGCAGVCLAVASSMTFAARLGLSPWVMAGIIVAAVSTFFALTMLTKLITGEERIIYYHHEIAVLVVSALLLLTLHEPVLPYLDLTILGIGLFLACGRVGCLMVGCCHGGPRDWGIRYRADHAEAGFPAYLVGVRLFPIQAVESLYVLSIVLAGSIFLISSRSPGEALGWYVLTYGLGRFCFEFMRGDPARPYLLGFSEAQWTSLFCMLVFLSLELSGLLNFHAWHAAATACLVSAMIVIAMRRRLQKEARHKLLHPRHVKDVAEAVRKLPDLAAGATGSSQRALVFADVRIVRTSLGVNISAGRIEDGCDFIDHYALSNQKDNLSEGSATTLADLILRLNPAAGAGHLIRRHGGIHHLLIRPLRSGESPNPVRE